MNDKQVRVRIIAALSRAGAVIDGGDDGDIDLREHLPDSLAVIGALVEIEDEFSISLPDDFLDAEVLASLAGLATAIAGMLDAGNE
ncbi:MAG: phosphopantetheine-binding protein [Spirochaetaceae bacterium]|nr:phosphopantetheine-binding protein [Spirochaetaceae bacterium]